jgi:hypothetical protein
MRPNRSHRPCLCYLTIKEVRFFLILIILNSTLALSLYLCLNCFIHVFESFLWRVRANRKIIDFETVIIKVKFQEVENCLKGKK